MVLGPYTKQVLETRFLLTSRNLLLENIIIYTNKVLTTLKNDFKTNADIN